MKWNHQTIGQIFDNLSLHSGLFRKMKVLELDNNWADIVGESISKHSSIADYSEGILTIDVDEGLWLHELKLREAGLISKINCELGAIAVKRIRFRIK